MKDPRDICERDLRNLYQSLVRVHDAGHVSLSIALRRQLDAFASVLKAHGTEPRQPGEALNVVRDQDASERVRKSSVVRLVGKVER